MLADAIVSDTETVARHLPRSGLRLDVSVKGVDRCLSGGSGGLFGVEEGED